MKSKTIFYIILAFAWLSLSIASGIMAILGKEVGAGCAFWPSVVCFSLYMDKAIKLIK